MMGAELNRFDEVRVLNGSATWTTLTPGQFFKLPLVERIQLIAGRKVQFRLRGSEVSPLEALKD
jgi:hypothetical protein